MVRTQIQLTKEQYRRLRQWADRLGISMAEAVRRCIEAELSRAGQSDAYADRVREALAVVGRYRSGCSDVAERHDDYLAEAFGG